jgi:lipopolysaccharide biosynthesis protein
MIFENSERIRRAAIYVLHDKDGIIDNYIVTMLNELKKHVENILVVVNGMVNEEGISKLKKCSDDILIRENKGYDITGYKEGIEYLTWQKIREYDECILVNSTLFGPIYPLKEMFDEMNKRDLDFWGITKHHSVEYDCFGTCKYGYIPEHIQSSFLVIRKDMINSEEYKKMWDELPKINSYEEAIGFFEVIFTKEFNEKGFKSDVYVNTDDLEGYTRYPLMMMSHELVKKRRCPVIKQKSFCQNYFDILTDTVGNCTVDTLEFIQQHSNYDTNLIWDNILRTCNMADIKNMLHLNYILPQNYSFNHENVKRKKVALMMHIYYADLIDSCLNYAKSMPENADLIITTPIKETYKLLKEKIVKLNFNDIKIIEIENRGRDVSSLLVGCAPYVNDYDYVCFMHDKKTTQMKPYGNGESFAYKCFENNLASKEYVENIISTFEKNPRLGLLTPPPPNHGNFYQIVGTEWASNFENTASLAYRLKLNCHVYWDKEPIAPLGTMFWFRPQAMKKLFDYGWRYRDFPEEPNGFDGTILHAIERVYAFVVQDAGYYPAWVMSDKFARIEFTNLYFMVRELNKELFSKYFTTNLLDMTQRMKTNLHFIWTRGVGKKLLIKKYLPKPIWNLLKKVYHSIKSH